MQKYVIEKSLSKHLIKVNGGKSKDNDDKAMIIRGYLGRFTERLTTLPQYIPFS